MTDNKPNDCRPIKWDDNNTACKGTEAKTTLIGLPMTNNAPPDGGLFLHIKEPNSVKWSEGCHRCEQRGFTPYHSTCPDCHGTGKREAWVEGEVKLIPSMTDAFCYYIEGRVLRVNRTGLERGGRAVGADEYSL